MGVPKPADAHEIDRAHDCPAGVADWARGVEFVLGVGQPNPLSDSGRVGWVDEGGRAGVIIGGPQWCVGEVWFSMVFTPRTGVWRSR